MDIDGGASKLRQRAAGIAIAVFIEFLLIVGLLTLGPPLSEPSDSGLRLLTFQFGQKAETAKATPKRDQPKIKERAVRAPPQVAAITPPPPKPITPSKGFVEVSKDEFAAMDISKFGSKSVGSAGNSAAPYGPGEGPGGKPLYNAEWVREPTDAELNPYFSEAKARPPGAWAMVACRTIANNRVDNCQTLDEFPRGAGLSKALRLAAWQFQVRPPRLGNKPQLGVWVRIRFDFRKAADVIESESEG